MKTGKCDNSNCQANHWDADKVASAKKLFGERLEMYFHPHGKK